MRVQISAWKILDEDGEQEGGERDDGDRGLGARDAHAERAEGEPERRALMLFIIKLADREIAFRHAAALIIRPF